MAAGKISVINEAPLSLEREHSGGIEKIRFRPKRKQTPTSAFQIQESHGEVGELDGSME